MTTICILCNTRRKIQNCHTCQTPIYYLYIIKAINLYFVLLILFYFSIQYVPNTQLACSLPWDSYFIVPNYHKYYIGDKTIMCNLIMGMIKICKDPWHTMPAIIGELVTVLSVCHVWNRTNTTSSDQLEYSLFKWHK